MTKALVSINNVTYGGLYYCAAFTGSGAQPTWTRLTTTGLPNLNCYALGIDPFDPLNKQYLAVTVGASAGGTQIQEIYYRNGGDWSLILDNATARTLTGKGANSAIFWMYVDQATGYLYVTLLYDDGGTGTTSAYLLQSTDNGSSWSAINYADSHRGYAYVTAYNNNVWVSYRGGLLAIGYLRYSDDGGATWKAEYNPDNLGGNYTPIWIDPGYPNTCYHLAITPNDVERITYNAGYSDAVVIGLVGVPLGYFVFDPDDADHQLYIVNNNFTNALYRTNDKWANETAITISVPPGSYERRAFARSQNETSDALMIGTLSTGEVYYFDDEDDTTPVNRSGANSGAAPYTNSLPGVGDGFVSYFGIWFGEAPSDRGIYLFSVEEGDITNIPDADNLGLPLFGDRSSWRDFDADDDGNGTPLADYHAQDIKEDTPQRHAPWPASSGQAPVSDGTKWVPTDIITQAEFDYSFYVGTHCPVTLDADAALILDLQGGCTPAQEIGLDVQQPTYVFIGPSFMPPDEPTFRPMYIEELANVTTTAPVLDGEVLTFDGATGEWVNEEPSATRLRTVTTLTAGTYTLDDTYDVVVLDATAGDIEINLPQTAANDGLEYAFKRIDDTANEVAIVAFESILLDSDGEVLTDSDGEVLTDSDGGGGDTIDGDIVQYLDSQYLAIQIVADADGSAWWII